MHLSFHGAVGTVTGANFLLETPEKKLLVDCGLFQGCKFSEDKNRESFGYDPATIDVLFVTHAHIDHVGRIPKLVRDGFRGVIYSTVATREIAAVMMSDSCGVLEKEARRAGTEPFYNEQDVSRTMALWRDMKLHDPLDLGGGLSVRLLDSGHILGSAMIEISYHGRRVVFTGDLGNSPAPLLSAPEPLSEADYLVMESVYGDRVHEAPEDRRHKLEMVIEDTVRAGGALLIPAFSLERTQVLLYHLNELVEHGRIPALPVFVDSPLAIKVTDIYKRHTAELRGEARREIEGGDDIFAFPRLKFTLSTEESKAINSAPNPKIIIAGSGMSQGGRIIHHERRHLPDPHSTLLLVGYQAAGSLGRLLQSGARKVTILGDEVPVRARVETISGYSAHMDSEGLLNFVAGGVDTLKQVFVTMGEPKASLFLVQRLRDYLGVNAMVPEEGKSYALP
ncbi:MAG: MBL fold metallo-hydrolase [bacterium]|nr:MBL fold metallo-hydrolase [bacterium]MDZ4284874.1 MBL fold metallo-hydrolase [Patescibacteria group bacterium]